MRWIRKWKRFSVSYRTAHSCSNWSAPIVPMWSINDGILIRRHAHLRLCSHVRLGDVRSPARRGLYRIRRQGVTMVLAAGLHQHADLHRAVLGRTVADAGPAQCLLHGHGSVWLSALAPAQTP